MNNEAKVVIVILNYNAWEETVACLASLTKETYSNYEALVIDNGSTNDSAEQIKQRFPRVKLIVSKTNLGYVGANNLAIKELADAQCHYALFLNSDTVIRGPIIDRLLAIMEKDPKVGAVSPLVISAKTGRLEYAGAKYIKLLMRYAGLPKAVGQTDWQTDIYHGAAMMMRTALLKQRGFNPALFLYCDEIEYSCWLRNMGYKIIVAGQAEVVHKGGASTNKLVPIYYITRNKLFLAATLLNIPERVLFYLIFFWELPIKMSFYAVFRNSSLLPFCFGVIDGLLGKMGKDRRGLI
jgi:GT2 family glycosyltransferase